jgi:hypothetical protein
VVNFILESDVPETTFTVASFAWNGSDLDGDDTILRYEWALDDTTATWQPLAHKVNFQTLTADSGLSTGDHVFYLRAIDLAGVASKIIRMPRQETAIWHVKAPIGPVLLLDDYAPEENTNQLYQSILDSLGVRYSWWDIKSDRDKNNKPDLLTASVIPFRETLKLFPVVIWYADETPHLEFAQVSLPEFLLHGGKIIFSTKFAEFFSEQGDPLDFSPADSLGLNIKRLSNGTLILPAANRSDLPTLKVSAKAGIIPFVKTLLKKPSALEYYSLGSSTQWTGLPPVALENADKSMVFFALPLHLLNGNKNLGRLIARIYHSDFGF